MKKIPPPLLMTSCVTTSAPFTAIRDEQERVRLTIESVKNWLLVSKDLKIVICDGSNFDFTPTVHEKFPYANIECIFFQNNSESVAEFGKGFGEGEIVNFALKESRYLQDVEYFAKCTSKLWVSNFFQCLKYWNGHFLCDAEFANIRDPHKKIKIKFIDTRFYFSSKSFFAETLSKSHINVRDRDGYYLEHSYRDSLNEREIRNFVLPVRPKIFGVSGSTGKSYDGNTRKDFQDRLRRKILSIFTNYVSN